MKTLLTSALLIAFFLVGSISVSAQIAGGYNPASVTDRSIKDAAAFAIKAHNKKSKKKVKLISIVKAQTQVVAGYNFNICLKVREGRTVRRVEVLVYNDQFNKETLDKWQWGGCGF